MTINNAHDAREIAKAADDPKLEQTLNQIEAAALMGLYTLTVDVVSTKLSNNLKMRGFSVINHNGKSTNYQERSTISW